MSAPRLGRYELVRKIAAGGMAEIFLARQWGAGGFFRDVVIKRLFKHLAEHPRQLRMFQDEGRLLAALSHPNIPQVYDVGFADGHWYVAMEFVDGWNVADVWRQGAKAGQAMPIPTALGVVMQACEALHHAHERTDRAHRPLRIVHRDVTPQNLMVTRDGVVKLMDFGVAQTTARKDTEAGAVRGTFAYMAPEQVRAKPLDKRADVFALGVILYELTTGSRLFRGSDVQIMTQVVEHDVPPPSSRVPDYPRDLEEIVLGALQRDRARRMPSAAHLAWRLEELAQRHGYLVGPRTVARYVAQVIPAEPVQEEELAMVGAEPPPGISQEIDAPRELVRPAEESGAHDLDDEGLLEDLQLLSLPPDAHSEPPPPEPIPLYRPPPRDLGTVESEEIELDDEQRITTPSEPPGPASTPAPIGIAELLAQEPTSSRPPRPSYLPRGVVPLTPAEVARAQDASTGDEQRPIVLLGNPKKPAPTGPKPAPRATPRDYVRELEKRLARDDDE